MEAREILGLDIGRKHSGVARSSNVARLAEPLLSLPTSKVISKLKEYTVQKSVESVVVGLPRGLDGQETQQTDWVRKWVDSAKLVLEIPLFWQDEALTTKATESQASQLHLKSQVDDHSLAAAVILQDFLDSPEADRVMC